MNDISEEQSAINDDNRLHYFCTVLYILSYLKDVVMLKIYFSTKIHCTTKISIMITIMMIIIV